MSTATEPRPYRRGPLKTLWPSPAKPTSRRAARKADPEYGQPAVPSWRDVDWSQHLHHVTLRGSDVQYVDLGEGDRAIVFVHGLGGSWQNWLENLPAVAEAGYRAVALDLPGFGHSAMPVDDISITNFAATVDALCDHLGLSAVVLVGNSMGGFTAAEVAIRHPERVERLVLVDAAGISTAINRNWLSERFGRLLTAGGNAGGAVPDPELPRKLLSRPGFVQLVMGIVARHPTLLARDLVYEQMQSGGSPGFNASLQAIIDYNYVEELSRISCPTLIVQGTDDFLVPLGDADEYAKRITRSTTLILEDTGHVPMLERPTTFNRALLEFAGQDVAPHEPDPVQSPTLATPDGAV
jgi:pimeloyl-ACP methyl ester carboxylesterase